VLPLVVLCWVLSSAPGVANGAAGQKPDRLRSDRIVIAYVAPANPTHQPIYETMKQRRVLERFKAYLSPFRLPTPLLLKLEGCDGESNAWYEEPDHSVTVCYEYIDEIMRNAPEQTTAAGVTRDDALVGPGVEVFLHEIGHAIFDLLKVPILGREEDAADQFADYMLLHLGKDEARRTIAGIAYMYGREAQGQTLQMKHFADVHGTSAQRFYNLLCLAYGAEPELFVDVVEKKYLPESRAGGCADEYRQVSYAVRKLILPYVDQARQKKVHAKKLLRPAAPAAAPKANP
jgi:hypothetical protein